MPRFNTHRPHGAPVLTSRQIDDLHYLANLQEDIDGRDYSHYGEAAMAVRDADVAYAGKVAASIRTGAPVWPSGR